MTDPLFLLESLAGVLHFQCDVRAFLAPHQAHGVLKGHPLGVLAADLQDHIAGFESGFGSRGSVADAVENEPVG